MSLRDGDIEILLQFTEFIVTTTDNAIAVGERWPDTVTDEINVPPLLFVGVRIGDGIFGFDHIRFGIENGIVIQELTGTLVDGT